MSDSVMLTKRQMTDLRKEVKYASYNRDQQWFKLATLLAKVAISGYQGKPGEIEQTLYHAWGYASWNEYVEKELGMYVTTANTMVSTAAFFNETMAGVWKGQVLSPQRMKAIAAGRLVKRDNLNEMMEKIIQDDLGPTAVDLLVNGHHRTSKKAVYFRVSPHDASVLAEILDDLMEEGDFKTRGEALMSLVEARPKKKLRRVK